MGGLSLVIVLGVIGGGSAQLATSWYYWRHRHLRGLTALVPTAFFSGLAAMVYGVALAVPEPETTKLLYGIYFCGLCLSTIGWFLFVLDWTERFPRIRVHWKPLLGLPFVTVMFATVYEALVVGADGSGALVATFEVTTSVGLTVPRFVPGRIGLVYAIGSFLLYVATLGLLLSFIRKPSQRLYRQQNQLLFFAMAIPAVGEITLRAFGLPFEGMPVTGLPATLAVVTAIFRYGIFNVSPVARRALVEDLDAGLLAYDDEGRIIDANELACSVLGTADQLVGTQLEAVLSNSSLDIETDEDTLLRNGIDQQEFALERGDDTRYFSVQQSTIGDEGETIAQALLFSDITEQRVRERQLDMLKQVFSRVLRHNLRNDMNVIEGAAAELVRKNEGRDAELARQIRSRSSLLFDVSEKARLVEKVVDNSTDRTTVRLGQVVEQVLERIGTEYPTASIDADLPSDLAVVAHPALEMAIENAVENAAEHGTAGPSAGTRAPPDVGEREGVSISVTATVEDETCTLSITDDGPGIPDHELAPLDERSETPLQHASGVGLWLIKWVVDSSDGSVSFETSDDGTTVTMELETTDASPTPGPRMRSITTQPDPA